MYKQCIWDYYMNILCISISAIFINLWLIFRDKVMRIKTKICREHPWNIFWFLRIFIWSNGVKNAFTKKWHHQELNPEPPSQLELIAQINPNKARLMMNVLMPFLHYTPPWQRLIQKWHDEGWVIMIKGDKSCTMWKMR